MFDPQQKRVNEQCDSICCAKTKDDGAYHDPKNRISCVVGISISGFKTFWEKVFDLMEIQRTQTFEQFLKA